MSSRPTCAAMATATGRPTAIIACRCSPRSAELVALLGPVAIVGHSLGGAVALRHAALFPETVTQLVAIEGLGPSPTLTAEKAARPPASIWRKWTERAARCSPGRNACSRRSRKRRRGCARGNRVSPALLRHLTDHGAAPRRGRPLRWKHDPLVMSRMPSDLCRRRAARFVGEVACPTLLVYGARAGRRTRPRTAAPPHFRNARVALLPRRRPLAPPRPARLFMAELHGFLDPARNVPA